MMRGFPSRWLRRLHVLRERIRVEREMDEEMRFHVEMEAEDLRRRHGLSPVEARRQALLAFGGVESHKEAGREARGIAWLSTLSLDFKLGVRLLRKHAALSIIGGLGMAVTIAIAAGFFTFSTSFYYSHPPLEEGDRIVAIQNRNLRNSEDWRATLFDFHTWRDEVRSIQEIAAFRRAYRNLQVPGGVSGRATVAQMTASGFRVARVAPLLGRALVETDEHEGAPPVVVVGEKEWQSIFEGDPDVLGRTVRLGGILHEVVGVMPASFRFPSNYGFWTALPMKRSLYGAGEGPKIVVFGRLAPGVSESGAQAELSAIGQRMTSAFPAVYERLRPEIVRYSHVLFDLQQYPAWSVWLMQLFAILLLSVVAINVAVLVYARIASRRAEITVRTALGAGRSRIVTQLFLEAFVLSLLAAALGLVIAQIGYRQIAALASFEMMMPYWIGDGLSPATIPYAVALAILAALLVGVLPALQATGRNLQSNLRRMGSAGEIQLGATWTALIVVQVAIAVAVLPAVVAIASNEIWKTLPTPTFPVDELLSLRLHEADDVPPARRAEHEKVFAQQQAELIRRLKTEPSIAGATYTLLADEARARIEIEAASARVEGALDSTPLRTMTRVRSVDRAFFDVMGVRVLAGRGFEPGDLAGGARSVIVNRTFVTRFFGGGNALGRVVRKVDPTAEESGNEPWYQIVGVVDDMYEIPSRSERAEAALYHPIVLGGEALSIAVRTRGSTPVQLAPRVREIAVTVAPDKQLSMAPMETTRDSRTIRFVAVVVGLMTLSVLLLSAAGIYALMSFAVTLRRREIGVRSALGARRGQIVACIFSRSVRQLALGLAVGAGMAGALNAASGGELLGGRAVILLPLVTIMMLLAGLFAAVGPARRALRIHPMDALRQE